MGGNEGRNDGLVDFSRHSDQQGTVSLVEMEVMNMYKNYKGEKQPGDASL